MRARTQKHFIEQCGISSNWSPRLLNNRNCLLCLTSLLAAFKLRLASVCNSFQDFYLSFESRVNHVLKYFNTDLQEANESWYVFADKLDIQSVPLVLSNKPE